MKQMPVEGRKFTRVDATWRELMGTAVKDPHALVATEQPNMLPRLVLQYNIIAAILPDRFLN